MSNQTITLEQLAELNAEIAALARAGVPLELALKELGRDLPGRLGDITTELGRRLEQGGGLADVVSQSDDLLPPMYRAVVVAGLRSGRLTAALEGLSSTVLRMAQVRNLVGVSLLYPLIVLAAAYGLFVWTVVEWAPAVIESFHHFGSETPLLAAFAKLGSVAQWWAPWLPLLLLLALISWWRRSTRRAVAGQKPLVGLPGVGRIVQAGRLATFADVLRLLVEQEVPLGEATILAAEASGDRKLSDAARQLAERIERGEMLTDAEKLPTGFPPMLAWAIASCRQGDELANTLRLYANSYHARAIKAGQWAAVYIPIFLAAGVGGTIVALLAVGTLGPWFELLYDMGKPI